jgi:hypothetical protein
MKADRMRQRLVQVLKREDDTNSALDVVVGRFWASAKPLRPCPRIAPERTNVVDLARWIEARNSGR